MTSLDRLSLILSLLLALGIAAITFAGEPAMLTEVERLRGQNLLLRIEQANTTERILLERVNQLRAEREKMQTVFITQQDEVFKAHEASADTHVINWDVGELTLKPAPAPNPQGGK